MALSISDRVSVTFPLSARHLDEEADRVLLSGLRTGALGVAICFLVFGIYNAVAMPPGVREAMVTYDVVLVLAGLLVGELQQRDRISAAAAPYTMAALSLAVVGNILLSLWIAHEDAAAFYVSLVIVIMAGGMLRTHLAAPLGVVMIGAWAIVAALVRTPNDLLHDVFVLFAGSTVAAISHFGQRREHIRLAELRARDTRRKSELERALDDAARARDNLDAQVEARTSELRSELAQRVKLEEQLRHAQKMDAVGRLAGGVAHDFNNLLTIIGSGLELADEHVTHDPDAREAIHDARDATRRATELTRGLLALGRKQTLDRAPTDVLDVIEGVERMITRLAGAKVRMVRRVEPDVGQVVGDRGQLEQVLLNLAINACDAMVDGGTLTIVVELITLDEERAAELRLSAGCYVRISVVDTGTGMDAATRASIFEPFFTTKPVGKGTGLGLAIAHGIVMQHGGAIEVESEPGRGSTFSVFLPRSERVSSEVIAFPSPLPRAATDAQTILVVEDEPAVRRSLARTLIGLGYHVVLAADGDDALRVADTLPEIDLLLSDVVMPGIDGPEVAARLRARWPALRVLFVSGYSDDRLARAGALGPRDRLLAKPYTAKALATAVHEVIAGLAA